MATAKLLTTPRIIEIIGSTIRIAHPNIKGNTATALADSLLAAAASASVYDNNGFANGDYFLAGDLSNRESEEGNVSGVVTRGQALTINTTLKFGHGVETPITKIFERGIKIYGSATDGGALTLIASVDAITTPIADAVMIQWDKPYTEYTLISTDTTYAFYAVKFTDGVTDSTVSTYVPSTGLAYTKLEPIIKQAIDFSNSKIDDKRISREFLVNWANDCQDEISQFVYQDPGSGRWLQKDWSYEVVLDESIPLVEGTDSYALSGLGYKIKYPNSDKSIISVQIGNDRPLRKVSIKDFDIYRQGVSQTLMNGVGNIGAVTITVNSTANFNPSGSLNIGSQVITYTSKTPTTFLGIPTVGAGAITTLISTLTPVWQNMQSGQPRTWTIFNGNIIFDRPPSVDFAGRTIRVRYFKSIPRLTSVSDGTEIPFTNALTSYITGTIYYRMGQPEQGEKWMDKFKKTIVANAQADYIPQLDEWHYYNFSDDVYAEDGYADTDGSTNYFNF